MARISVTVADDTLRLLREAAQRQGISLSRYLRESGIYRAGLEDRATLAELEQRIARIEQRIGSSPG